MERWHQQPIKTKKGPLQGRFQIIVSQRVLVLVSGGSKETYPIGTVFDRNRRIERTSPNGTAWAAHDGIYDAHRAALHKMRRLGPDHGEMSDLRADHLVITAYVNTLLDFSSMDEREKARLREQHRLILARLSRARTPTKQKAFNDLIRAGQRTDRLGRPNVGAAVMAGYAGRHQEQLRAVDVRGMIPYLDTRAVRIQQMIARTIGAYEVLADLLGMRHATRPRTDSEIWSFVVDRTHASRRLALDRIVKQLEIFDGVRARPFLKNVWHLLEDLEAARTLLSSTLIVRSSDDQRCLVKRFRRMRQGIAWALALHFLEMEIRTPLSLLLGDIRGDVRRRRLAIGDLERSEIVVDRTSDPRFERIHECLERFRSHASGCSDSELIHPVKTDVLAHAKEALEYFDQDDLPMVVDILEKLANIL